MQVGQDEERYKKKIHKKTKRRERDNMKNRWRKDTEEDKEEKDR